MVAPTFSQAGAGLNSEKHERLHILCPQCGKTDHNDKMLRDQCRLMTALLGQGWGSKDRYNPAKNIVPLPHVERKVRSETATEEEWLAELDLLTRFNEANRRFIKTSRPRLTRVVTTVHENKHTIRSVRLRLTKTNDAVKGT